MGEPGVGPVPCLGFGLAEAKFRAVLGRSAVDAVHPPWLRSAHDAVGADAADQLDGQAAPDPRQSGDVVAGIADDHDMGR